MRQAIRLSGCHVAQGFSPNLKMSLSGDLVLSKRDRRPLLTMNRTIPYVLRTLP